MYHYNTHTTPISTPHDGGCRGAFIVSRNAKSTNTPKNAETLYGAHLLNKKIYVLNIIHR